jgi:hypothetical protein
MNKLRNGHRLATAAVREAETPEKRAIAATFLAGYRAALAAACGDEALAAHIVDASTCGAIKQIETLL